MRNSESRRRIEAGVSASDLADIVIVFLGDYARVFVQQVQWSAFARGEAEYAGGNGIECERFVDFLEQLVEAGTRGGGDRNGSGGLMLRIAQDAPGEGVRVGLVAQKVRFVQHQDLQCLRGTDFVERR